MKSKCLNFTRSLNPFPILTESREQRVESREQRVESREQRVESREQRVENKIGHIKFEIKSHQSKPNFTKKTNFDGFSALHLLVVQEKNIADLHNS